MKLTTGFAHSMPHKLFSPAEYVHWLFRFSVVIVSA